MALAAAVEREAEHPLAKAVAQEAERAGVPRLAANGFRNVPGHGAAADVAGRRVLVGNPKFMADEGVELGDLAGRRDALAAEGVRRSSWPSTAEPPA